MPAQVFVAAGPALPTRNLIQRYASNEVKAPGADKRGQVRVGLPNSRPGEASNQLMGAVVPPNRRDKMGDARTI